MSDTHFEGFEDIYPLNLDWVSGRHPISDTSLDDYAANDVENRHRPPIG